VLVRILRLRIKLNTVMLNKVWLEAYGQTAVEFLEDGLLDHSSAIITVKKVQSFSPKPFKFWVERDWMINVEGTHMYQLYAKIKSVLRVLKRVNAKSSGDLHQKVIQDRCSKLTCYTETSFSPMVGYEESCLSTGYRQVTWGYQGDAQCVFCRNGLESRDHLFFKCSFSSRIWIYCLQRCDVRDGSPSCLASFDK
jgi:hypothetical protein